MTPMNIRIEKQDMQTAMLIETDLDQIVAENFGDICEALAKHINALVELQNLQYQNIKADEVVDIIRKSGDANEAAERLCQKLDISVAAAQLVLKTPLSGLDQMLDSSYLDSKIEQHMGSIQAVIWPLFSY